jgi:hypothetical protein
MVCIFAECIRKQKTEGKEEINWAEREREREREREGERERLG